MISKIQNPKSKIKALAGLLWLLFFIYPSLSISGDKLTIYTVNYPLKYFAERIAGEHATVVFPAPKDVDPAYWMPGKKTIMDYQKADLILMNGAYYAKWTEKATLPRSKMVHTSKKFKDRYIKSEETVTHSHGPSGKHAHEDAAFTIWLDLDLAVRQAEAIKTALISKRPDHKPTFERKFEDLKKDLMTLDEQIKEIVANKQRQPLIASHPVYQYFTRRYGLNVKSVHWEPDEKPDAEQWMELNNMLQDHHAQWMIWERQPLSGSIEQLKRIGVMSIVFDPCGNAPEKGDFLSVMQRNIENLRRAF